MHQTEVFDWVYSLYIRRQTFPCPHEHTTRHFHWCNLWTKHYFKATTKLTIWQDLQIVSSQIKFSEWMEFSYLWRKNLYFITADILRNACNQIKIKPQELWLITGIKKEKKKKTHVNKMLTSSIKSLNLPTSSGIETSLLLLTTKTFSGKSKRYFGNVDKRFRLKWRIKVMFRKNTK